MKPDKTFNQQYRDNLAQKLKSLRAEGKQDQAQELLKHEQEGAFYGEAKREHQEEQLLTRMVKSMVEFEEKYGVKVKIEMGGQEVSLEKLKKVVGNIDGQIKTEKERENKTFGIENEEVKASKKGFEEQGEKIVEEVEEVVSKAQEKGNSNYADLSLEELKEKYAETKDLQEMSGGYNGGVFQLALDDMAEEIKLRESQGETQQEEKSEEEVIEGEDSKKRKKKELTEEEIEEKMKDGEEEKKEEQVEEQEEKKEDKEENEKKVARVAALLAIIASAEKALAWMKGKNAMYSTPSMIHRQESKIRRAKKELERIANGESVEGMEEKQSAIAALAALESRNEDLKKKKKRGFGFWGKLKHKGKMALIGAGIILASMFGPKTCESPVAADQEDTPIETVDSSYQVTSIEKGDGFTQVNERLTEGEPLVYSLSEQFKNAKEEGIKMGVIQNGNEVRLKAVADNGDHLVGGLAVKIKKNGKEITKYFSKEDLEKGGYDEHGPNDFDNMKASVVIEDGKVTDNIGATYEHQTDTYYASASQFNQNK